MARPGKKRKVLFVLEIIVLLLFIGGLYVYGQISSRLDKIKQPELKKEEIVVNQEAPKMTGYKTYVLFGIDSRGEGSKLSAQNSDTMIIVSVNNDTKEVKMASVYRDTLLNVGNDTYTKANAAYAYGGPEQAITMLNTNLDLDISDYATADFSALVEVVDDLGGLEIPLSYAEIEHMNNYCVETSELTGKSYTPIEKPDPAPEDQEATVDTYHLNGVQAVAYARIRKTSGNDFRRAARQREVIYKIVEKAKNSSIATLNTVLDKIFPMIYTSLTEKEILSMGMNMLSYDIEDQTGFPFDHLYGDTVKEAMDGVDCVLPITLESNVIKLHEFLYPEDSYVPSNEVKTYSQEISDKSGFGEESRLEHSEDGSLAAYRETDTESADTTENTADTQEESTADTTGDTQGYDESSLAQ